MGDVAFRMEGQEHWLGAASRAAQKEMVAKDGLLLEDFVRTQARLLGSYCQIQATPSLLT